MALKNFLFFTRREATFKKKLLNFCRLAALLAGYLAGCLVAGLAGSLARCLRGWLDGQLTRWLPGGLAECLAG